MSRKILSVLLAVCMIAFGALSASAAVTELSPSGEDYGLAKRVEDGNILQCFNWTLNQIKAELPNIAKAGFTSVQTSPLQKHDGNNTWYWLYQPTGFTLGNEIGSYDDLKSLCIEADKYGVKIIVDVVANHLAGSNNGSWSGAIESSLRNSAYFHNQGACSDYDNRYDLTHKNIGMPDLNSENTDIQNKVAAMVSSLKSAGVDGIRWDAAKHIGLPSESCQFWPVVTNSGLYNYGEILEAPAGDSGDAVNKPLMKEYTDYMNVTDDVFSGKITAAMRDGTVYKTNGYWIKKDITADKLVYWGESHDTYSNSDGWTKNLSQNIIDRAYAILAARADAQTLYLSRPSTNNYSNIKAAVKGSTHFTSPEVAAVNHFHNAMVGTAESCVTGSGCNAICRGGGAVIVSAGKSDVDVSVRNGGGLVPEGTYTDEVSGSTWTVTSSTITGHIGSTGIAVIYNAVSEPEMTNVGDVNDDGTVNNRDAVILDRFIAGWAGYADMLKNDDAADLNRDGSINNRDGVILDRYIAGWDGYDKYIVTVVKGQ